MRHYFGCRFAKGILIWLLLFAFQAAYADTFPTKPVTVVLPMGTGGSGDLTMRAIVPVAEKYLGQPLLTVFKSGGSGVIGADFVGNSEPDGYTLLFGGPQYNSTIPAVEGRSKGPKDLEVVCRINYSPAMVAIRPDLPFKTFRQMMDWCRANPGKLRVGTLGPWNMSDLFWRVITRKTGIPFKHIPYDGGSQMLIALLGNHIDATAGMMNVLQPYMKAGKMLVIATMDNQRDKLFPEMPTVTEEGIDFTHNMWRGILAPKGTPRSVRDKLAMSFKRMLEDETVVERIRLLGDKIQYLGPDEFTKVWQAEFEVHKEYGKVFKEVYK